VLLLLRLLESAFGQEHLGLRGLVLLIISFGGAFVLLLLAVQLLEALLLRGGGHLLLGHVRGGREGLQSGPDAVDRRQFLLQLQLLLLLQL